MGFTTGPLWVPSQIEEAKRLVEGSAAIAKVNLDFLSGTLFVDDRTSTVDSNWIWMNPKRVKTDTFEA